MTAPSWTYAPAASVLLPSIEFHQSPERHQSPTASVVLLSSPESDESPEFDGSSELHQSPELPPADPSADALAAASSAEADMDGEADEIIPAMGKHKPLSFYILIRTVKNRKRQLCHRCEANIEQSPFGDVPYTGGDTFALPTGTCGGGICATITFLTYVFSIYLEL